MKQDSHRPIRSKHDHRPERSNIVHGGNIRSLSSSRRRKGARGNQGGDSVCADEPAAACWTLIGEVLTGCVWICFPARFLGISPCIKCPHFVASVVTPGHKWSSSLKPMSCRCYLGAAMIETSETFVRRLPPYSPSITTLE